MTNTEEETFDDMSFYVGEDGFDRAESVYDSDISLSDNEGDDDDLGDWWMEDGPVNEGVDEYIGFGTIEDDYELPPFNDSSPRLGEGERCCPSESPSNRTTKGSGDKDTAANDNDTNRSLNRKRLNKSKNESMATLLTMASSDEDTDDGNESLGVSAVANSSQDVSAITNDRLNLSGIMEEALSMMEGEEASGKMQSVSDAKHRCVDTVMEEVQIMMDGNDNCDDLLRSEKYDEPCSSGVNEACGTTSRNTGLISRSTLDKILQHPLQLSAFLTILAHRPIKKENKCSTTRPYSDSHEIMPTI